MGSFFPIILVILIVVCILFGVKKYKASKASNPMISNRKNKGEVWKTIKQYLKDHNMSGREIIDSDVRRRQQLDYLDPNLNSFERNNKKAEIRLRKFLHTVNGKAIKIPYRDLYVVSFQTKNSKTNEVFAPQCFECEVINTKAKKGQQAERKIIITGTKDYEQEMRWMGVIRQAEKVQFEKNQARMHQTEQRKKEKLERKKAKQKAKLLAKKNGK